MVKSGIWASTGQIKLELVNIQWYNVLVQPKIRCGDRVLEVIFVPRNVQVTNATSGERL